MLRYVRDIFAEVANSRDNEDVYPYTGLRFRMSDVLYNQHVHLYRQSRLMIDQLEQVLKDGEHRLVIEEGQQLKLRMPHIESFDYRIAALRGQLDSYDPRDVIRLPGGTVHVPINTARNMHATALHVTSFVFDFFSEIKRSDYMKYLRRLRDNGVPYAGPGAIQDVLNTYLALHYVAAFTKSEVLPVRLPVNWTRQRPPVATTPLHS